MPSLYLSVPTNSVCEELALAAMQDWAISIARRISYLGESIEAQLRAGADNPATHEEDLRTELRLMVTHLSDIEAAHQRLRNEIFATKEKADE